MLQPAVARSDISISETRIRGMIFDFAKCSGDNTDLGTYDKLPSGSLVLFMDSSPGEEFALVPPVVQIFRLF